MHVLKFLAILSFNVLLEKVLTDKKECNNRVSSITFRLAEYKKE